MYVKVCHSKFVFIFAAFVDLTFVQSVVACAVLCFQKSKTKSKHSLDYVQAELVLLTLFVCGEKWGKFRFCPVHRKCNVCSIRLSSNYINFGVSLGFLQRLF